MACLLRILLLSALLTLGWSWSTCKSSGNVINITSVNPVCVRPCSVREEINFPVSFSFKVNQNVSSLNVSVKVVNHDVPTMDFPLEGTGALCSNPSRSGISCPLQQGHIYTARMYVFLPPTFPPMRVNTEWRLMDEKNTRIGCFSLPFIVVK